MLHGSRFLSLIYTSDSCWVVCPMALFAPKRKTKKNIDSFLEGRGSLTEIGSGEERVQITKLPNLRREVHGGAYEATWSKVPSIQGGGFRVVFGSLKVSQQFQRCVTCFSEVVLECEMWNWESVSQEKSNLNFYDTWGSFPGKSDVHLLEQLALIFCLWREGRCSLFHFLGQNCVSFARK